VAAGTPHELVRVGFLSTRGFVDWPEQGLWSSFRHYAYRESGLVAVNERTTMKGSGKGLGRERVATARTLCRGFFVCRWGYRIG
jgi:hypothetical protein